MTTLPRSLEQAITEHDAFTIEGEAVQLTTVSVETTLSVQDGGDPFTFTLIVEMPSLDACVRGQVAAIVATDWFGTLERRLADGFDVTTAATDGTLSVDEAGQTVRVEIAFTAGATAGLDDAKALAEFVEGTYVQGLIPGYEYTGIAASLRNRAKQRGDHSSP